VKTADMKKISLMLGSSRFWRIADGVRVNAGAIFLRLKSL
jgi:hypothetical protein